MIKNNYNSFSSLEETKCSTLKPQQSFPSLSQSSVIELILNQDIFLISKDNPLFIILYTLLHSIPSKTIQKNSIISITLPCNLKLTKSIIEVYFECLISLSIPSLELPVCHQLVSLCLFFNDKDTLIKLIKSNIEPNINKYKSIDILSLYSPYITHEQFDNLFLQITHQAISVISSNMFYIISNMRESLLSLDDQVFERIISLYFKSELFNQNIDHSLIMNVLMAKRDINDVFELLENERKDSINKFELLLHNQIEPSLEWSIKIEDPTYGLYIESEEFAFDNISNQIIAYYDYKKDVFNIALKIVHIKYNEDAVDIDEDITFSQRKFAKFNKASPDKEESSISIKNNNISNSNNNNKSNSLNQSPMASPRHNDNHNYCNTNQFIISLLSLCEIPELDFKLKINFNCIFSNSQTKVLISKIENFKQKFTEKNMAFNSESVFTIRLFFNISYNFSSILTHICKNFYQYHSLPSIKIIPKNVLNIILRNEELNIQSEDEMLIAVLNWLNCRNSHSPELLLEIARNMNWSLISMEGLFEFIHTQSKLMLNNIELQDIIAKEINSRFIRDNNYCEDETSFLESKVKLKRKYIPTSKPIGSKRSFTSELLSNILKLILKNNTTKGTANNHQQYNHHYHHQTQCNSKSNMSNTIAAISNYNKDDNVNSLAYKKISMNNSAKELSQMCLMKGSLRNSKEGSTKRYENHNSMKPNDTTKWKNIMIPMSYTDHQAQYFKSERLNEVNNSSACNRNKLINSIYSNKSNLSNYSHREKKVIQAKEFLQHKDYKSSNCNNISQSLYPDYINNANKSKKVYYNIPNQKSHNTLNKKKKISNLIKMAKRESKENLRRQLKRSQSNFNSSSAKNLNSNQIKSLSDTKSFLD